MTLGESVPPATKLLGFPCGSKGKPRALLVFHLLEPAISLIGEERWAYAYAWQTLRQAGARLAFGSDWPISDINPLRGIHAAVTRKAWKRGLPAQRQSLHDALLGYTATAPGRNSWKAAKAASSSGRI